MVVGLLAGTAAAGPAGGVAAAADTICVALVVDFADLGAGVDSDCVTVPAGSSGEDVLRARHTLGFRPNQPGFVCTIDGWPHEGCSGSNGEHYWAYFHRAPGASSWTYSTAGASGYEPKNNSTEGWVWLTRKDQTPANVAFSAICTATSSPKPRPSTSSPTPSGGGGGGGGTARTKTSPSSGGDTSAGTADLSTDAATGKRARTSDGKRSAARTPSRSPAPTSTPTDTDVRTDESAAAVLADSRTDDDGSPPYGLVIGAVVVTGLGAAAVLRARRNRGMP